MLPSLVKKGESSSKSVFNSVIGLGSPQVPSAFLCAMYRSRLPSLLSLLEEKYIVLPSSVIWASLSKAVVFSSFMLTGAVHSPLIFSEK